jgi:hypothetical protein
MEKLGVCLVGACLIFNIYHFGAWRFRNARAAVGVKTMIARCMAKKKKKHSFRLKDWKVGPLRMAEGKCSPQYPAGANLE